MFSVYNKLKWYFVQEKKRYFWFVVLSILTNYLMTLPPKYLSNAIDAIASSTMNREGLVRIIGIMVVLAILLYVGMNLRTRLMQTGSYKLQYLLRNQLMSYLTKMDAHYFAYHETGDLMAVATTDINAICLAAAQILQQLLSAIFMMFFVVFQMAFFVNTRLTFVTILPLPFAIMIIYLMSKRIRRLFVKARDAFGEFNNTTLESVAGVQVVRAFVQEEYDIKKLKKVAEKSRDQELKAMKLDSAFGPLFRAVFSVSLIIAITYGVYLVFHRQITAGQLVAFNIYLTMLRMPLWSAGTVLNRLQRANAAYDRFEENTGVSLTVEHTCQTQLNEINSIVFENYSFTYPKSEFESLKNITLEIHKGETIGIVGKTGSGKTTIIMQLLRYYAKGNGRLLINHQSIDCFDYMNIRSFFGYVPQEHILFSKTVKENILLGAQDQVDEATMNKAIELADFKKDIQYLKDGLETLCGEDGTMLSGGQKQRLSIARAFIKNPEILILDDSLSAVDGNTEATIIKNLKETRKDKTNIIIAHRLSAVAHADRIYVVEQGRIVECGSHESLLMNKGWYYEQYQNQILKGSEE